MPSGSEDRGFGEKMCISMNLVDFSCKNCIDWSCLYYLSTSQRAQLSLYLSSLLGRKLSIVHLPTSPQILNFSKVRISVSGHD